MDLVHVRIRHSQRVGQRGIEPVAGTGRFEAWMDQTLDDQSEYQVSVMALAAIRRSSPSCPTTWRIASTWPCGKDHSIRSGS